LHADGHASAASFRIVFRSTGRAGGVFHVRSADPAQDPRTYTVEPGRRLTDAWDAASGYDLSVHGPNGFFRRFKGGTGPQRARLNVRARYSRRYEIALELENRGSEPLEVTVTDRYSSRRITLSLKPGDADTGRWSLGRTRGWYDLVVTVQGDPAFEYRYAGHLENGKASISDPGMGGLI
jgi:phospholipase C